MLHLDPADHYGSQWASHSLDAFLAWAGAAADRPGVGGDAQASCSSASEDEHAQPQPAADLASLPTAPGTADEAGEPASRLAVPCACWRAGAQVHFYPIGPLFNGLGMQLQEHAQP